ncbi:hypothetical protein CHU93_09390 [Sandarakinorhabdus cyanobacteriorum]|uniref:Uncharacterized protein n=1 Tax=Sandarakinorhabdus cyanobacteriorum TaxID=1981098 RepID=A0A255YI10_9SPHN|nr:hypothetical protein CHU93_09390 [Sandarakinorhabdus cyanobacteriorum]
MARKTAVFGVIGAVVIAALAYAFWPGARSSDGGAAAQAAVASILADLPAAERAEVQAQLDAIKAAADTDVQNAVARNDVAALATMAQQSAEAEAALKAALLKIEKDDFSQADRDRFENQKKIGLATRDQEIAVVPVFTGMTRLEQVAGSLGLIHPEMMKRDQAVLAHAADVAHAVFERTSKASPIVPEALARFAKLAPDQRAGTSAGQIAQTILSTEPCFGVQAAAAAPPNGALNTLGVSVAMSAAQQRAAVCAATNQPVRLVQNKTNEYCITCSDDTRQWPLDRLILGDIIVRERQFQSIRRIQQPGSTIPDIERDAAPVPMSTIMDAYVRQFGQPNYSYSGTTSVTYAWIRRRDGTAYPANHWTIPGKLALNGRVVAALGGGGRADQMLRDSLRQAQPQASYCLANLSPGDDPAAEALAFGDAWPINPALFHFNKSAFELTELFKDVTKDTKAMSAFEAAGKNDDCGQVLVVTLTRDTGQRLDTAARVPLYTGIGTNRGDDAMSAIRSNMGIVALSSRLGDAGSFITIRREKRAAALRENAEANAEADRQAREAARGFKT